MEVMMPKKQMQIIHASPESLVLADALHSIADAIREFTRVYAGEDDPPQEPNSYLDGSPRG